MITFGGLKPHRALQQRSMLLDKAIVRRALRLLFGRKHEQLIAWLDCNYGKPIVACIHRLPRERGVDFTPPWILYQSMPQASPQRLVTNLVTMDELGLSKHPNIRLYAGQCSCNRIYYKAERISE